MTGVNVFNQKTQEFEFRPGPMFANVVLGDEINRAPPKTQAALLEAMEEQQVSVDGTTHPFRSRLPSSPRRTRWSRTGRTTCRWPNSTGS